MNSGGMEVYIHGLAKSLQKSNIEVTLLISDIGAARKYLYDGLQIQTYPIPESPTSSELNGLTRPRGIEEFESLVRIGSPDLVHFHSLGRAINAYCIEVVSRLDIPVVLTVHRTTNICIRSDFNRFGTEACNGKVDRDVCLACFLSFKGLPKSIAQPSVHLMSKLQIRLNNLLPSINIANHKFEEIKRIKENTQTVIALSKVTFDALQANGIDPPKLKLVSQGISVDMINAGSDRKSDNSELNQISFGYWGRIHPEKGIRMMIKAIQFIDPKEHSLTIIGAKVPGLEGFYAEMQHLTHDMESIKWVGGCSQQQLPSYLSDIDVLILPTVTNEMAPLVILEAFAFGIPVIGSDCTGISSMVEHGRTGLLFEQGQVSELTNQLRRIVNNPELVIEFSKNIGSVRSLDDVGRDMLDIYQEILSS